MQEQLITYKCDMLHTKSGKEPYYMKIKSCTKTYEEVMQLPRPEHVKPKKPSKVLATAVRLFSMLDLMDVDFTYTTKNMEKAGEGPWLILMNHSSFLDLMIASKMLYPKPYNIVCTSDGLVGKEGIMRSLGCIPTQKFVTDPTLIADINYALHENHSSVLMYPEASYSFDGTTTPLPRKMGVLLRMLKVPVIMITTYGSFTRDPLYNNLQKRKVKVSAVMECLLSPEEIKEKTTPEMDRILDQAFDLDYFKWQQKNHVIIDEPFRADGLNRILYQCPHCGKQGNTEGKGTKFICHDCGTEYELTTEGKLHCLNGETKFDHIPDWYAWEREKLRKDILDSTYSMDTEVEIGLIVDFKSLYMVGSGTLHHDRNGFVLDGCDGKLHYEQGSTKCYSLYSDYFWYEIGDIICIGNKDCLYYCFPKTKDIVARTRIAQEEIFKVMKAAGKKSKKDLSEKQPAEKRLSEEHSSEKGSASAAEESKN